MALKIVKGSVGFMSGIFNAKSILNSGLLLVYSWTFFSFFSFQNINESPFEGEVDLGAILGQMDSLTNDLDFEFQHQFGGTS